ncbi:MAG: glycosyl hydrolase [Terrimicrobiaceae bacterium]
MTKKKRKVDPARPASSRATGFIKKGLGSCSERTTPDELSRLNLGWYYNWRPFPKIAPVPGVEFVPMFWNAGDMTVENFALVNQSAATHVLGFNEPDMIGQANMTPEECLEAWPQLMTLKQRLGSPAPATSSWLEEFLPAAKRRGLRVDFVCIHRYPDISDPDAVGNIEKMLKDAHRKYRLPVWFTECGAADVRAWHQPQLREPNPAMARAFLKKLLAMLEGLPFVERYAWFADRVGEEYGLGTIYDPTSSRLTPFGKIYRDGV